MMDDLDDEFAPLPTELLEKVRLAFMMLEGSRVVDETEDYLLLKVSRDEYEEFFSPIGLFVVHQEKILELIQHVRKKVEELTQDKFCTACQKMKPREGGKNALMVNGRFRWKCADCLVKEKQARKRRSK